MKHSFIRTGTCLILSVFLLLSSCQKQIDTPFEEPVSTETFIAEAKAWFANGPVQTEKKMLELPFSVLPVLAPQRLFARMGKIQKRLEWETAEFYNRDGVAFLVVPITVNKRKYGTAYEIAKAAVFYKSKGEAMRMNVTEVMSKKGESLNGKEIKIIATAFLNKLSNKQETVVGINADVYFYNEEYKITGSYEFKNKMFISSAKKIGNKNKLENANSQSNLVTNSENGSCQTWYVIYEEHNQNGELVYWELLYTYQVGDCGGGGDPEEEMPEGEGGGGEEQTITLPPVTINVQHNCLKQAILNLMSASSSGSNYANLITSLFSTTYSSPSAYANLTVQQSNPPTTYSAWTTPGSTGNYTININPYFFNGQSFGGQLASPTKEFWASQFIHEIVHTFILEMNINQSIANNGFAQHELMITTWVNSISSLMQNMYGMDAADGNALALGGMLDVLQRNNTIATAAWESYIFRNYQVTTTDINNILRDYLTANKGTTTCN